ncbi:hypothetical protein E2320_011931 [Naja naja]|nr:hypothetical protein E2320_011931 [Naja naja]
MTELDWARKGIKAAGSGGRADKTLLAQRPRRQHPPPSLDIPLLHREYSLHHRRERLCRPHTPIPSVISLQFLSCAETSVGLISESANGQQRTRLQSPLQEAQALDLCLFLGLPQADFYIPVCSAGRSTLSSIQTRQDHVLCLVAHFNPFAQWHFGQDAGRLQDIPLGHRLGRAGELPVAAVAVRGGRCISLRGLQDPFKGCLNELIQIFQEGLHLRIPETCAKGSSGHVWPSQVENAERILYNHTHISKQQLGTRPEETHRKGLALQMVTAGKVMVLKPMAREAVTL